MRDASVTSIRAGLQNLVSGTRNENLPGHFKGTSYRLSKSKSYAEVQSQTKLTV